MNRSNFSKATKQKIAACINRKEKSLGCGKGKPAKAKGSEDLVAIEIALTNSEIFKSTKALVDKSLESKDPMDLCFDDCLECEDCE